MREAGIVSAHALDPRVVSIVFVGYDTLILPPPVKNEFRLTLGIIMIMCSDSAATCGTVITLFARK